MIGLIVLKVRHQMLDVEACPFDRVDPTARGCSQLVSNLLTNWATGCCTNCHGGEIPGSNTH